MSAKRSPNSKRSNLPPPPVWFSYFVTVGNTARLLTQGESFLEQQQQQQGHFQHIFAVSNWMHGTLQRLRQTKPIPNSHSQLIPVSGSSDASNKSGKVIRINWPWTLFPVDLLADISVQIHAVHIYIVYTLYLYIVPRLASRRFSNGGNKANNRIKLRGQCL